MEQHVRDPGKRLAQKLLAREVTLDGPWRVGGGAGEADQRGAVRRGQGGHRRGRDRGDAASGVSRAPSCPPDSTSSTCCVASGLASSKADARRGIQGKGFYLNGEPIESADFVIDDSRCRVRPTPVHDSAQGQEELRQTGASSRKPLPARSRPRAVAPGRLAAEQPEQPAHHLPRQGHRPTEGLTTPHSRWSA